MMRKISFQEYTQLPELNCSKLKDFIKSEQYYYLKYVTKEIKDKDNANFAFGRACHCYILESEKFNNEYVVDPGIDKRTKEGKDFMANLDRRELITADEFIMIKRFATQLANRNTWTEHCFLADVHPEVTLVHGSLKAMCDRLIELPNQVIIYDLKTTAASDTDEFMSHIGKYGYDYQDAFYTMMAEAIFNKPVRFIFVPLFKGGANEVAFVELDHDTKILAKQVVFRALTKLKDCMTHNTWKTLPDQIITGSMKPWDKSSRKQYLGA